MVELVVRWFALSAAIVLGPLRGSTALQCKFRDGETRRSYVALQKDVEVPAERCLDGQKHVNHQVKQEPALQDLMGSH